MQPFVVASLFYHKIPQKKLASDKGVQAVEKFNLSNGKPREPDLKTYPRGGKLWVDSKSGGVSLFDKLGVPNSKWLYYRLSIGFPIRIIYEIRDETFIIQVVNVVYSSKVCRGN